MKNIKLITLLKTFSKEEMKSFGKFVCSPYFNSGRNLKPLYTILKKHHPEFDSLLLDEKTIFARLKLTEKLDNKKSSVYLRVLYSDMTKLARKFMVYDNFERGMNNYEFNHCLAKALNQKKLPELSLEATIKSSKILDINRDTLEYYQERLLTNLNLSGLYKFKGSAENQYECQKNNLLYVYASFFHYLTVFSNNNLASKFNFQRPFEGVTFLEKFIEDFNIGLFKKECPEDEFETKNITLYNYYILKSIQDVNDKDCLIKALELYYSFFDKLKHKQKFGFFVVIFNILIFRDILDDFYNITACELIEFTFSRYVFSPDEGDYLGIEIYHTALTANASLFEAAKLKDFVVKYVTKVPPQYREDLKYYSMAYVFRNEGKFEKCLEAISRNDSLPVFFKLKKYLLKLICLYEQGNYEESLYASESFEKFLRRNKIGKTLKETHLKCIKMFKELVSYTHDKNKTVSPDLMQFSKSLPNNYYRNWLSKKIKQIS